MVVGTQIEVIDRFRHNYVRFEALRNGLTLWQPWESQRSSNHDHPALEYFLARCVGCSSCPPVRKDEVIIHLSQVHDSFVLSLAAEVERIQLFIKAHLEQLWLQLLDFIRQIHSISQARKAGQGPSQCPGLSPLQVIAGSLNEFGNDLYLIESFGRQNVMLCALLAQMKDQRCYSIQEMLVQSPYLACMECQILGDFCLDPLILGLSDTYELLRQVECDVSGEKHASWTPPDKFQRLTRKFWLMPADVTKFKCTIIKHLPILIFGDRQKLTQVDSASVPLLSEQHGVSDSGLISSVYYDNPEELNTYHTRLRKEDYATAVRVRWYGERRLNGDQQLFVERKQHRDSWSGQFSSKDRAQVQQRYLSDYMAGLGGPPGMDGESRQAELLREVQDYIAGNKQVPLLRTVYRRTAFQKSSNNLVRISMDTELRMVKEMGAPRTPGDWCRDCSDSSLSPDDVAEFPYAVVEIKLQAKPPDWIIDLVHTGILLPLPRFSKFLHGVACLYQHMTDQLPNWFLPDETNPTLMTSATWEEMADTSDEYLKKAASWLFPANFDPPAPGSSAFSFLRRKKALAAAPACPGSDRTTAAATARRMTEFELACERLPEAEEAPSEGGASSSKDQSNRGDAMQDPYNKAIKEGTRGEKGSEASEGKPPSLSAAPASTAVPCLQTWPQYCHSSAAAGAAAGMKDGFLPANYAALGFSTCGARGAAHRSGEQGHPPLYPSHTMLAVSSPLLLRPELGRFATRSDAALGGMEANEGVQLGLRRVSSRSNGLQQGLLAKSRSAAPSSDNSAIETPVDSAKDVESGKGAGCTRPLQQGGGQPSRLSAGAYGSQLYQSIRGSSRRTVGEASLVEGGAPGSPTKVSSRAAALVRTRVEPKTFFANERTFLQWLQISVLVMMIAFALLSGTLVSTTSVGTSASTSSGCPPGDKSCVASKISGAIIAPVALLFMGYSLFMYKKRTIQILRRQTVRYDDQRGPVALVSILLVVMITAYVISLIWIF